MTQLKFLENIESSCSNIECIKYLVVSIAGYKSNSALKLDHGFYN